MYNLTEAYKIIGPDIQHEVWNGRFACALSNSQRTFLTNSMKETLACYTFTLVRKGEMLLETNGQTIAFKANDLYIYAPGFPVYIHSVSEDYESTVLLVDEQTTYETPAFRNLMRASFFPLVQYGRPKLSVAPEDALRLNADMLALRDHIQRPTDYSDEVLEMLYSVFLLDMLAIQENSGGQHAISRRAEDIFLSFYSILRRHYTEQHSIGYYSDQLHITATYLSRIVKQVSGRTVIECIDQMLSIEAAWLLTSTSLSIAQIASRLNFASSASFDKFFLRMRGQQPKSLRGKRAFGHASCATEGRVDLMG
ncbi:MAG: helix-turn-helix transcriptional regulator [Prevotella sp.]|nr:helix-turn-helix transcriptional regulator [Prevotella sp.]